IRAALSDGQNAHGSALGPVLDETYETMITALTIAKDHGVKAAVALGEATSIMGLAPDVVDTTELLYRASVIQDNLDGLDKLRAAAEEQRQNASVELRALITHRHRLEARREELLRQAHP